MTLVSVAVKYLTIAVMLLHGICGCCWHHGHDACDSHSVTQTAPHASTSKTPCRHTCGHQHQAVPPAGSSEEPDDHAPHSKCHDGACVYMTSRSVEIADPALAWAPIFDFVTPFVSIEPAQEAMTAYLPPPQFESVLDSCARLRVWRI
jgi:hypothetical protein